MDLTTLRTNLRHSLKVLGGFTSDDGEDRLDVAILSSAQIIRDKFPWGWKGQSTYSLTTTAGTKGPYDVPSDFSEFPLDERLNKFQWGDQQQIYVIKDSTTRAWDIYWDEAANTFYFRSDPGGQTLTLYYIAEFDLDIDNLSTTLSEFPNYTFNIFEKLVPAHILDETQNKKISQALEAEGMERLAKAWATYRRGKRKANQRAPRGLNQTVYDGIAEAEPLNPNVARMRNQGYVN